MKNSEERKLFTIKEFAHACGVSRTSLIRMEECGFLMPFRTDPESGYRYYDAQNAAAVGQFQLLQTLGLSRREVTEFYLQQKDSSGFIREQKTRLSQMQRALEELELRSDDSRNLSFSFVDMPEITCYCRTAEIYSFDESEAFFYETHTRSIQDGYRMMGTEPLFGLSETDFRISQDAPMLPSESTACIPVMPEDRNDPHLVTFPACQAFSGLAHGDYRVIGELCVRFWQEVEKRGLTPVGRARFIGLVAPYTGKHIRQDQFCYRLVVPIESNT